VEKVVEKGPLTTVWDPLANSQKKNQKRWWIQSGCGWL